MLDHIRSLAGVGRFVRWYVALSVIVGRLDLEAIPTEPKDLSNLKIQLRDFTISSKVQSSTVHQCNPYKSGGTIKISISFQPKLEMRGPLRRCF